MKNMYEYDEIQVDYCKIGEPAVLLITDYSSSGVDRRYVITPSPVVAVCIDSNNHTRIETEMSVVQTRNF